MWIKVCGICRQEDALAAAKAGAQAIGFVFAPSPRQLPPQKARELTDRDGVEETHAVGYPVW